MNTDISSVISTVKLSLQSKITLLMITIINRIRIIVTGHNNIFTFTARLLNKNWHLSNGILTYYNHWD